MANFLHTLPYPIRNAKFALALNYRTSAGDAADPTSADTEVSLNEGATYSDCTNEVSTGGGNGQGYITLTQSEMAAAIVMVAAKSSNCVTTQVAIYPRELVELLSSTLSAVSGGGGTIVGGPAYDITNCFALVNGEARIITSYVTTTGAFTVSNWETTPSVDDGIQILLPTGVTKGMLWTIIPATLGRKPVVSSTGDVNGNVNKWLSTTVPTPRTAGTPDVRVISDGFAKVITLLTSDTAKTVIEAQTAGTLIRPVPGVWTVGDNQIVVPDYVSIIGHGKGVSRFTCSRLTSSGTSQLRPGTQSLIQGITWQSLATIGTVADIPIGIAFEESGSITNAIVRDCEIIGLTDDVLLANTNTCSIKVEDSILRTAYDALTATFSSLHEITANNVEIFAAENTPAHSSRGIYTVGKIRATNVNIRMRARAATTELRGIQVTAGGRGEFFNCSVVLDLDGNSPATKVSVAGVTYDPDDAANTQPNVLMANSQYDRATAGNGVVDWCSTLTQATAGANSAASAVTKATAIQAKTDNLPASPAATGAAMTLTTGERTALQAAFIDESDGQAVLAAMLAKINTITATDFSSLAIAAAVRTNLATELGRLDAAISTRLSTAGYTVPSSAVAIIAALLATTNGAATLAAQWAHLDGDVSDAGGGGDIRGPGADPCTITLAISGSPVADADVWITASTSAAPVIAGTLQTNSEGQATFLLDAGVTYYLWAQKDGVNSLTAQSFTAVAD